jgi:methionyl-tRNA synthetase
MNDDAETALLLQRGKLDQVCPDCGRKEAAGYECTACARPTGPAEWYRPAATASEIERLTRARAKRHPEAASRNLSTGNGGRAA